MKSNLPKGWALTTLGEICQRAQSISPGGNPTSKFHYVDIASIENTTYRAVDTKEYIGKDAPSRARQLIHTADTLISTVRPYLRKIAFINSELDGQIASTGFTVVRPKREIDAKYIFYNAISDAFINSLCKKQRGASYPAVRDLDVFEQNIALPSLAEQRRIVAQLDAIMVKLQANIERLEKLPVLLKKFRKAVLAAAVSGKLTEVWRAERTKGETAIDLLNSIQRIRIKGYNDALKAAKKGGIKPRLPKDLQYTPKAEVSDDIPAGWAITEVKDVADCLDYIRRPVNKDERLTRIGTVPYYGANGRTGWIDDYLFDEDLVVIVEDETFDGRELPFSYIIRGKSWVNNHAHVMRPVGGISADYLNICWSYYNFTPLTSGSTGRKKLTQGGLLQAPFVIAPLAEQEEIVRQVNHYFELADQLEVRFEQAAALVEQLPQALLAKAFSGQLVPQDPNDEPANALLERLQTSAVAPAKGQRGRKPKATSPTPLFN